MFVNENEINQNVVYRSLFLGANWMADPARAFETLKRQKMLAGIVPTTSCIVSVSLINRPRSQSNESS